MKNKGDKRKGSNYEDSDTDSQDRGNDFYPPPNLMCGRGKANNSKVRRRIELANLHKEVSDLYLRGYPQYQIAELVNCGINTVAKVLMDLKEQWLRTSAISFDEKKSKELARIDQLEQTAWDAWEHSRKVLETTSVKREQIRQKVPNRKKEFRLVPGRTTEETIKKGQNGDPRFLDQIAWCIETRLRMMGLLKGEGTNIGSISIDWNQLMSPPKIVDPLEEELLALENNTPGTTEQSPPNRGCPNHGSMIVINEGTPQEDIVDKDLLPHRIQLPSPTDIAKGKDALDIVDILSPEKYTQEQLDSRDRNSKLPKRKKKRNK